MKATAEGSSAQQVRELAKTYARTAAPTKSRARVTTPRPSARRVEPLAPTPERARLGDIVERAGVRVAIPQLERLRSRGQLDHDARANEALYVAGDRLRRHRDGAATALRGFDPTRIAAGTPSYEPDDSRLKHAKHYQRALVLLGGADAIRARVVLAIVLEDQTVEETAKVFFGPGKAERIKGAAKDALRSGLFTLAVHWGLA